MYEAKPFVSVFVDLSLPEWFSPRLRSAVRLKPGGARLPRRWQLLFLVLFPRFWSQVVSRDEPGNTWKWPGKIVGFILALNNNCTIKVKQNETIRITKVWKKQKKNQNTESYCFRNSVLRYKYRWTYLQGVALIGCACSFSAFVRAEF